MIGRAFMPLGSMVIQFGTKNFSSTFKRSFKVAVAGAAGGIGQPLSLLLKQNSLITHLALYDIAKVTPGVAADLSHIDTPVKVTGHKGPEQVADAMRDADVVVIPAGMPRKPGMTRDDLFATNASILRDIVVDVSKHAPKKAIVAIITNPVNSLVPIATEVLKKAGRYDPRRVLGVTTLDIVRSCTFIGEVNCISPTEVSIPVVGGHSGVTIVPVLSRAQPAVNLTKEADIMKLISRIQEAGTEVLKAKAGGGTATLAMAYAGARFMCSVLRGLAGESNVIECAYVKSDLQDAPYFANPIVLGKNGLEKNLGPGTLNELEMSLLKKAIPVINKNIKTGEKFVTQETEKRCK